MSAYDNVVVGKLKLKGKALDVKAGGMKKKKKQKKQFEQISQAVESKAICNFFKSPEDAFINCILYVEKDCLLVSDALHIISIIRLFNKSACGFVT